MAYVNAVFVQPSVGDAAEASGDVEASEAAEAAEVAEAREDAEAVDPVVDQNAPEASKPPAVRTVRLDGVMGMPNDLSGNGDSSDLSSGWSVGLDQVCVNIKAQPKIDPMYANHCPARCLARCLATPLADRG
jgi:hypothetical protein